LTSLFIRATMLFQAQSSLGHKIFWSVNNMAGKKKQVRLTKAELIERMKQIQERK
jgi:hypothetical protein